MYASKAKELSVMTEMKRIESQILEATGKGLFKTTVKAEFNIKYHLGAMGYNVEQLTPTEYEVSWL